MGFDAVERRAFLVALLAGPLRRAGGFRAFFSFAGFVSIGFFRTAFLRAADGARRRFIIAAPPEARGPSS